MTISDSEPPECHGPYPIAYDLADPAAVLAQLRVTQKTLKKVYAIQQSKLTRKKQQLSHT